MQPIVLTNAYRRPRAIQLPQGIIISEGKSVYGCADEVVDVLRDVAGVTSVILPTTFEPEAAAAFLDHVDGILLPGSVHNIDPSRYGEKVKLDCQMFDEDHDEADLFLVRQAREKGIPFLGICRGMQAMNVAFGGGLIQKIKNVGVDHYCSSPCNGTREDLPFTHSVRVMGAKLSSLLDGAESVSVNSLHGQAIQKIGDGLVVEAEAVDGVIEAVSWKDAPDFFMGVQWHPECMPDHVVSKKIFEAFGAAVRRRQAAREEK